MEALAQLGISSYFALIAGLGLIALIVTSIFDHIVDVDHGDSVSLRLAMLFITGFGIGGFMGARTNGSVLAAVIGGIAMGVALAFAGYGVATFFQKSQANSVVQVDTLLGREATVALPIPPGGTGEIHYTLHGVKDWMPAVASDPHIRIGMAARVRVTGVAGGRAIVEPISGQKL